MSLKIAFTGIGYIKRNIDEVTLHRFLGKRKG